MRSGKLAGTDLTIAFRMNDEGTIFADGMGQDHLDFDCGRRILIAPATQSLHLVVG